MSEAALTRHLGDLKSKHTELANGGGGDTEQTPISLAELYPAEYQYLKAKLQPSA